MAEINFIEDAIYFLDHVSMSGSCWIWTGAINVAIGYGKLYRDGRDQYAHRWSYELFVGPIKHGLEIDHLCRVRSCVNPKHLEAVTHQVNMSRGIWPGSQACVHGLRPMKCKTCRAERARIYRSSHPQVRQRDNELRKERRLRIMRERVLRSARAVSAPSPA